MTSISPNAVAMTLHSTLYYMVPNSVVQDRLILNQAKLNVSGHNDFNLTKRCRHYVAPSVVAITLHPTLYYVAPNSVVQDRLILNQSPNPEPSKTKCLCP